MSAAIAGPAGQLEAALHNATAAPAGWVIMCHPHPQYGGSMHNNVVEAATQAATQAGFGVATFNCRGVGQSEGTFDGIDGATDDLLAVFTYLATSYDCPADRVVAAGYSFGAAVAAQIAAHQVEPRAMLWVAPPIGVISLPLAAWQWAGPKQIIVGAQDPYCDATTIRQRCAEAAPVAGCHIIDGADHFLAGREPEVREAIGAFLRTVDKPAA